MKLYVWNNGACESDYQSKPNVNMGEVQDYSSDQHSGGIVVVAKNFEDAVEQAVKKLSAGEQENGRKYLRTTQPAVVELSESGLVLYASGNC